MDIAKTAYPKFQEKLQVCKDILYGFDYSEFFDGQPLTMAKLIADGVNFVLDAAVPTRKDQWLREALLLHQAHTLCASLTTEEERHYAAYFEAIRATVSKIVISSGGKSRLSLTDINREINELLKSTIQREGVINLFDSKEYGGETFSLFDPEVLEEISKMKQKNIAVEVLKKLLAEQVQVYTRTNLVQSKKFSEKIKSLMNAYYNGLITNEEVIKELLETAQQMAQKRKEGQQMGLTDEEMAFYDALTRPEAIKDFYIYDKKKGESFLHIGSPKTKTSARTIPVPSLLMNIIKKFYTENPNHYFLTGKTTPTEPRTYRQFFTRFLKRNGLEKVKFHEIRHTFAVRAIEIPEFDIKSLSEILGHKNVSFTLNVYGSANLQQKVKCMNLLNDLL